MCSTQPLDRACPYQQPSPDLLDLQSSHRGAHHCLTFPCLSYTGTLPYKKLFISACPCSHCQEEEKNGQHGFNPSCSSIMCYQHILYLLDNETERFGEVWLGRNCFCPSSYWPSLVTSGQATPMMKWPNPSRCWGWSIRRQWHPFALLHQPKVQVSPAWHAALPRGGAENPAAPPLSREEAKHCPSPPLAEEGGSGPPRSGGWDSDKTITKLADTEKRLNVIGQATKQTSWTHGNTCSKSVLHCFSSQAIWSQFDPTILPTNKHTGGQARGRRPWTEIRSFCSTEKLEHQAKFILQVLFELKTKQMQTSTCSHQRLPFKIPCQLRNKKILN